MKRAAATLVLLAAFFALGFGFRDFQVGKLPSAETWQSLLNPGAAERPRAEVSASTLFSTHFAKIQADYARPVEEQALRFAGASGLVAALGDPHTAFLEPVLAQEFMLETTGNFVGIGARLGNDPMGARTVSVFEDGPAFQSGLKPGDIITAVDGKPVVGWDTDEIVKLIRGEEGKPVVLTVFRTQTEETLDLRIVRRPITIPSVESEYFADRRVGYVRISSFAEPTVRQFAQTLDRLEADGATGLVIDVRGNPGGLLNSAVAMLSNFIDGEVVVRMRGRDGGEQVERTRRGQTRGRRLPMIVLIDKNSASASEIFAGVLRDYGLATLVGEHTYGKASVQSIFRLRDDSSLKVTIARYYLPKTGDISRKVDLDGMYVSGGMMPDVESELEIDTETILGDPEHDSQLRKALEVLARSAST